MGRMIVIGIVSGVVAALVTVGVLRLLDVEVSTAVIGGVVGAVSATVVSSSRRRGDGAES